jgi:hypothetical protein
MIGFIVMLALAADPALTTLMGGPMSAVEDSKQVVARTAAEWTTLWKSHAGAQAAPAVDFSTDMVAAVFMGTQPTGGFSVEIVATRREADALIIEYVERRPGRRDVTAQVLTSPFHIVKLPKHGGPIRFERRPDQ